MRFPLYLLLISTALVTASGGCNDSSSSWSSLSLIAGPVGGAGSADDIGADARFNNPHGVVSDGNGNLFVADTGNGTIRKVVLATGEVTTLAGQAGELGSTNDMGANARFRGPRGLASDGNGNLFVADHGNHAIRKVAIATGMVTTLAGKAGEPGTQDGTGDAARFFHPSDLASDGAGSLYVADNGNKRIRKVVIESGAVTTPTLTDQNGSTFSFVSPYGVASDQTGSLYVADVSALRKVDLVMEKVTTLAGKAGLFGSTDGTGADALFSAATSGVALDGAGNLFVADGDNNTIRKVVIGTGVVTTFAGLAGQTGSTDETGTHARFGFPAGVASDGMGHLFVADSGNDTIRKMVIATGVVTTLAGTSGPFGSTDETGIHARFNYPSGVASDGKGHLFVADSYNSTIRNVAMATGVVTTLAGDAIQPAASRDGTGANARFSGPSGVAWDRDGNLFIADQGNHTIRKLVIATGEVTTLVGQAGQPPANVDGTGDAARFNFPAGVASDGRGNLFVADAGNDTIRKVQIATREVITLAGQAGQPGSTDETGANARFNYPTGVALDGAGNLFVSDSGNNTIRKMVVATRKVTTIGGQADQPGSQDGIGTNAQFNFPRGVGLDKHGNLYIADNVNHTIRKMVLATGEVTTFAGVAGSDGIRLGPLPARLSFPRAVAMVDSKLVVLSGNAVLLMH